MRALLIGLCLAICFVATSTTALALPNAHAVAGTANANDRVRATVQSSGRIYIGGDFTTVGGRTRPHIAALKGASGKLITSWRARVNGRVYALLLSRDGATLYAGGAFTKVNGVRRKHVVALRANSGKVIRSWSAGTDGTVRSLALRRRTLYLGGDFKTVKGQHRVRLAAVSRRSGRVKRWHALANRAVWSLAVSGRRLFAGGDFTKVAGQGGRFANRQYFVALKTRKASVTSLNPAPGFPVRAIRTMRGTMFLGTAGECSPGQTCNAALAYSSGTGALTWRCQTNGDVHALARTGGVLYVGGHWTSLVDCQGAAPGNPKLMALDRTNGSPLTSWHPGSNGFGILALAARGLRLAVGGQFTRMTGAGHANFAEFKGNLGSTT
jgi:Domain of unknown function (DUF5122) beta-propeller